MIWSINTRNSRSNSNGGSNISKKARYIKNDEARPGKKETTREGP